MVRRGYDRDAVDAHLRRLTTEKAGLGSTLAESERRTAALEQELGTLREQLPENHNPSYAGLGGRASAMLRLAEEEADEVRDAAPSATPSRSGSRPPATRSRSAPTPPARPRTCGWSSSRSSTRPAPG